MLASRILINSTFAMTLGLDRYRALMWAFKVERAHGTDKPTLARLWDILVGGTLPAVLA